SPGFPVSARFKAVLAGTGLPLSPGAGGGGGAAGRGRSPLGVAPAIRGVLATSRLNRYTCSALDSRTCTSSHPLLDSPLSTSTLDYGKRPSFASAPESSAKTSVAAEPVLLRSPA